MNGVYTVKVYRTGNNSASCVFYIDDVLITHQEDVNKTICEEFAGYRYGFNGKEKDDNIKGQGNSYDYGNRMLDVRLGKFLSIDQLHKEYPWFTPFQFAGNTPITALDLDGLEILDFRAFYRLKVEKTEIGVSYSLLPAQDKSVPAYFRKNNITLQPVNISYIIHKDINPFPQNVPSSNAQQEIVYSATQAQIDAFYGREIATGFNTAQKFININNNFKVGNGNAIAQGIIFILKYVYNNNQQEKDFAYADLNNVKLAFANAFRLVQNDIENLKKNGGQANFNTFLANVGVSQFQLEEALIQYIADGSFTNPVEATNTESAERRGLFSDFIQKAGKAILDANKSKLFQNVEQQSETKESETTGNDSPSE